MPADGLRACPVCGGVPDREIVYPQAAPRRAPGLRFDSIALCSTCGLGVALPRPRQTELDRFYQSGEYWRDVGDNVPQAMHEKVQAELRVQRCAMLLRAGTGLRVLDVGAGHGWTADWLASHLAGRVERFDFVEPDERHARTILEKRPGFRISRVRGLAAAGDHYDLIFLNHVLEHVAEPIGLVTSIAAALAQDGVAYVEMPHSDYRFKVDVFPHTLFFTPESLAALAKSAGVEQIGCEEFGRWRSAGLFTRLLQHAFVLSARHGAWVLQRHLDHALWRYREPAPGIWLRWLIRRAHA